MQGVGLGLGALSACEGVICDQASAGVKRRKILSWTHRIFTAQIRMPEIYRRREGNDLPLGWECHLLLMYRRSLWNRPLSGYALHCLSRIGLQ